MASQIQRLLIVIVLLILSFSFSRLLYQLVGLFLFILILGCITRPSLESFTEWIQTQTSQQNVVPQSTSSWSALWSWTYSLETPSSICIVRYDLLAFWLITTSSDQRYIVGIGGQWYIVEESVWIRTFQTIAEKFHLKQKEEIELLNNSNSNDSQDEIAEYKRQAVLAKMAHKWKKASALFLQAASYASTSHTHSKQYYTFMMEAYRCLVHLESFTQMKSLWKEMYTKLSNDADWTRIGKMGYEIGMLLQSKKQWKDALDVWESIIVVLETSSSEENIHQLLQCRNQRGAVLIQLAEFTLAMSEYEELGTAQMNRYDTTNVSELEATHAFFKALLCSLVLRDSVTFRQVLERILHVDDHFESSRYYLFLTSLLDCQETHNVNKCTALCESNKDLFVQKETHILKDAITIAMQKGDLT